MKIVLFDINQCVKNYLFWLLLPYSIIAIVFQDSPLIVLGNQLILFMLMARCLGNCKYYFQKGDSAVIICILYLSVSALISWANNGFLFSAILKEITYEILPILFYFVGKNVREKNNLYRCIILLCVCIVVIGCLVFFKEIKIDLFANTIEAIRRIPSGIGMGSYLGPIEMGYIMQFCFAIILFDKFESKFKIVYLLFFLAAIMLTTQRSPIIGILISTFFFIVALWNKKEYRSILNLGIALLFSAIMIIFLIGFYKGGHYQAIFFDTLRQINIEDVMVGRREQMQWFSTSLLQVIFGAGLGAYSPNNPNAFVDISDAVYFRIINELGCIGFCVYFFQFIVFIKRAFVYKNYFLLYVISFSLISLFFNRTIWIIHGAYLFFLVIGVESNKMVKE